MAAVALDIGTLYADIDALIDAPALGATAPSVETFERTLTDGYARALTLEAERSRLERQIGDIVAVLNPANRNEKTDELAVLSTELSRASSELAHLRDLLAHLRRRATIARLSSAT